jgi:P27 family predicted phage terminase small subunit
LRTSGQRPKPAILKRLHGSDQPVNPAEPIPVGDLTDNPTECPPHFNEEQRAAWEYAVRNSPPGLLKRIDGSALEAWVVAHCLHRRATREQNARPSMLFRQGTQVTTSPLIGIINRQAIIMLRAAGELGFTPVSRPRIQGTGPVADTLGTTYGREKDAPQRSLEDYLAGAPRPAAIN